MKVIYLDLSTDPDEGHPITGIGAVCRGILWRREIDPDDDDRERAAIIALFGLFKHLAGVDEGRSEVICLVAHCGRTFDFIHLPRRMDMLGVKPPNLNIFLFDSRLLANKKGFVEKSRGKLKFLVRHFLGRRQTHDALQDAIDLRDVCRALDDNSAPWWMSEHRDCEIGKFKQMFYEKYGQRR